MIWYPSYCCMWLSPMRVWPKQTPRWSASRSKKSRNADVHCIMRFVDYIHGSRVRVESDLNGIDARVFPTSSDRIPPSSYSQGNCDHVQLTQCDTIICFFRDFEFERLSLIMCVWMSLRLVPSIRRSSLFRSSESMIGLRSSFLTILSGREIRTSVPDMSGRRNMDPDPENQSPNVHLLSVLLRFTFNHMLNI